MENHDELVESIYKKVLVTRKQLSDRTREMKNELLTTRLTDVFHKYYALLQNPKIPQDDIKQCVENMNRTLDICIMHSDNDVIKELTTLDMKEKYKQKILNQNDI